MTRKEILAAIGEIAREHLGQEGPLAQDTRLVEDLGLDSIRLLTLAAEVENRFRIVIEPEQEAGLATVGDLVRLVADRIGVDG